MESPWDNNMGYITFGGVDFFVLIRLNCDVGIEVEVVSEFLE